MGIDGLILATLSKLEETEEQRTQRLAVARRKRTSTIARPRDWKRKGHAYRSRAAMESGSKQM